MSQRAEGRRKITRAVATLLYTFKAIPNLPNRKHCHLASSCKTTPFPLKTIHKSDTINSLVLTNSLDLSQSKT